MGHLKTINFLFGTNGKLMVLVVPILKYISAEILGHLRLNSINFLFWTNGKLMVLGIPVLKYISA